MSLSLVQPGSINPDKSDKENTSSPNQLDFLPKKSREFIEATIDSFEKQKLCRNETQDYIDFAKQRVRHLIQHSNKEPWHWKEGDFERWCYHLGQELKLATTSQRKYQCAIRTYIEYLINNDTYCELIMNQYGVTMKQICTRDNCIPHIHPNEAAKIRLPYSYEELDQFFDASEDAIEEAIRFNGKTAPLERDRVLFSLIYTCGLRADEALQIDLGDFASNPNYPEFGKYAYVTVSGKGSKGSGKKARRLEILSLTTSKLLKDYVTRVRPKLLQRGDANDMALFLSERGERLSYASLYGRFLQGLKRTNIDRRTRAVHALRHSFATHMAAAGVSLTWIQEFMGHINLATTQGYTHVSDPSVRHIYTAAADNLFEGE